MGFHDELIALYTAERDKAMSVIDTRECGLLKLSLEEVSANRADIMELLIEAAQKMK